MAIRIYGIKNCDTMKKAFALLDKRKVAYEFHDYKKAGVPPRQARRLGEESRLGKAGEFPRSDVAQDPRLAQSRSRRA